MIISHKNNIQKDGVSGWFPSNYVEESDSAVGTGNANGGFASLGNALASAGQSQQPPQPVSTNPSTKHKLEVYIFLLKKALFNTLDKTLKNNGYFQFYDNLKTLWYQNLKHVEMILETIYPSISTYILMSQFPNSHFS